MVAFSCCVFDGGEKEKEDMKEARERGWKGKFTKPGRVIRPGAIRINGKCPLTPLEVQVSGFVVLFCYIILMVNLSLQLHISLLPVHMFKLCMLCQQEHCIYNFCFRFLPKTLF